MNNIIVKISTQNTGENTAAENQAYIATLKSELSAEFSNQTIAVEMTDDNATIQIDGNKQLADSASGETAEKISEIINDVWSKC